MGILISICSVVGVATLVYFLLCMMYAGLSTSFTLVWLLVSLVAFSASWSMVWMQNNNLMLPRWARCSILVMVFAGIAAFSYAEGLILYYGNQSAPKTVEYLLVLGARVKGTTITGSLQKRLDTALTYLKDNEDTKVIVTGGKGPGEDITEGAAMAEYLIAHGIEPTRILKEEKATNTYENIQFSRELIRDADAQVAIVTNRFHIFRSVSMAKAQGMTNVVGLSAPTDPILGISYYTREAIAVLKYKITGHM